MESALAGHPAIGAWEIMNEPAGSVTPGTTPTTVQTLLHSRAKDQIGQVPTSPWRGEQQIFDFGFFF